MRMSFYYSYIVVAVTLAAVDFIFAWRAFRNRGETGRTLGLAAVFAGGVTLAYVASLLAEAELLVSVASSLCFAGIDWMLVTLVHFSLLITDVSDSRTGRGALPMIMGLAAIDTVVLFSNVFTPIAVTYTKLEPFGITYQMGIPYVIHLVFTYALVVVTFVVISHKCVNTPRQYKNQYLLIMAAVGIMVIINAIFLFPKTGSFFTRIDCSVLGYSVGLFLMYWIAFQYQTNDMLKALSKTIFENVDQGIVLFDYTDRLIMRNQRAEALLTGVNFQRKMNSAAFLRACGVTPGEGDRYSVQCDLEGDAALRCDFRRLRDDRGGVIGNLFVLTDISRDRDLTTGYEYARDFKPLSGGDDGGFPVPTAVVIFDIEGLREINRRLGRDAGDRRIRGLAKVLRQCMPQGSSFVRGYEADLIAISPGRDEKGVEANIARVLGASESAVLYGLSTTGEGRSLAQALETAYRSLQIKKLLSAGSVRSQTLNSLVRALEETDSDTEAHVRRTQKMGEALGRRVGLTDVQLTELELLCLLHDIGKIGVPLEILNKPDKLTDEEWHILKTHPEKGYQIAMATDEMKSIAQFILCHHERWDGRGYPKGLSGEDIPILSRIIAVVDAYDAMVNDRSYRKAMPPERAQEEIRVNAGSQFDPTLAAEFLKMLEERPDIAVGESVGAGEVPVFSQRAQLTGAETGVTSPIDYSRYVLDINQVIIEVDDRFTEITGYTAAEAVGKMVQFDLVPKEDRAYYIMQVDNQFAKGSIAYLRHEIQRKDGSIVQVACCGKRYFDSAARTFRNEIVIFEL